MANQEISKKVYGILKEVLQYDKNLPTTFDDDISQTLDSVEFVTLIVEAESMFNIEIDDEDFEIDKMGTINKISELIETYMNRCGTDEK